jgi:hypothetical protein
MPRVPPAATRKDRKDFDALRSAQVERQLPNRIFSVSSDFSDS